MWPFLPCDNDHHLNIDMCTPGVQKKGVGAAMLCVCLCRPAGCFEKQTLPLLTCVYRRLVTSVAVIVSQQSVSLSRLGPLFGWILLHCHGRLKKTDDPGSPPSPMMNLNLNEVDPGRIMIIVDLHNNDLCYEIHGGIMQG